MAGVFENSAKSGTQYIVQDVHDVEYHAGPSGIGSNYIPDDGPIVTQQERQSLIRGLGQRHIQMIAIAGAIVCSKILAPEVRSPTNIHREPVCFLVSAAQLPRVVHWVRC
jgi:hypothetical protein